MKDIIKVKWQGIHWKRSSHAFLSETKAGGVSLCGRETLTSDGVTSDEPQRIACGSCVNKIKKLNSLNKQGINKDETNNIRTIRFKIYNRSV